jgi:hypothetical protein
MDTKQKAYFRAADVVTRALKEAAARPQDFSASFQSLSETELQESQEALAHLSRLGIDAVLDYMRRGEPVRKFLKGP